MTSRRQFIIHTGAATLLLFGLLRSQPTLHLQLVSLKIVADIPHRIFFRGTSSDAPVQLTALVVINKDSQVLAFFSNGEMIGAHPLIL
jgi:hypothetical protein